MTQETFNQILSIALVVSAIASIISMAVFVKQMKKKRIEKEFDFYEISNSGPGLATIKAIVETVDARYPVTQSLVTAREYLTKIQIDIKELERNNSFQAMIEKTVLHAKANALRRFINLHTA